MTANEMKLVGGGRAFHLNLHTQELFRERQERIQLTRQQWNLLQVFISSNGALISRDALIAKVWGGKAVTDDAISRAIKSLREALGDKGSQSFIATVHGRGYRFVAEISYFAIEDKAATTLISRPEDNCRRPDALDDRRLKVLWPPGAEELVAEFDRLNSSDLSPNWYPKSQWKGSVYTFCHQDEDYWYWWAEGQFELFQQNESYTLSFSCADRNVGPDAPSPRADVTFQLWPAAVTIHWLTPSDQTIIERPVSEAAALLYSAAINYQSVVFDRIPNSLFKRTNASG